MLNLFSNVNHFSQEKSLNLSLRILPKLPFLLKKLVLCVEELLIDRVAFFDHFNYLIKHLSERIRGERILEAREKVKNGLFLLDELRDLKLIHLAPLIDLLNLLHLLINCLFALFLLT